MEVLTIGIFCALLIICIITGKSILYALLAGLIIFSLYGKKQGYSWRQISRMALQGAWKVKNILLTFILIGMLTALWRQAGTIPAIICYTVHLIKPSTFLLMTFLLNCLISVLTGTALGTAATIGVVCATMASALGIPSWMTGGAILSGVYFGDRCSPVSTSALLVAELTETGIYTNIKNMIKSALAPFTITCILYLTVSIQLHGKTEMPDLGHAFTELPELLLNGFHSTDVTVAAMLNGGGITSMLKVGAIVCISSSYSGIFQATGILNGFQKMVCLLADRTKPYFAVLVTSILTSVMACNQTLAIMLTDQLCSRTEPDKLRFANNLEDSAVLIAPLVPWSIACVVPLTAAGAPGYSVLFAVFLYLLPLCDLVLKK